MANFRGFHGMIKCTLTACVLCVLSGVSAAWAEYNYTCPTGYNSTNDDRVRPFTTITDCSDSHNGSEWCYGWGTTYTKPDETIVVVTPRILGKTRCSNTAGTSTGQIGNPSATNGNYCWCQTTAFGTGSGFPTTWTYENSPDWSPWVYAATTSSTCDVSSCAAECRTALGQQDFRAALYGCEPTQTTVTYDCGTKNCHCPSASGFGENFPATPSGTAASATATYGQPFSFANGNSICSLNGFVFNGWDCRTGTNASVNQTTNATSWNRTESSVTCTAQWDTTPANLIIQPGTNGHGGTTIVNGYENCKNFNTPTVAQSGISVDSGYEIIGWTPNVPGGGPTISPGGTSCYQENYVGALNLLPVYRAKDYIVTYDCGSGATGNIPNQTVTYDSAYTLDNGDACSKGTSYFNGWNCTDGLDGSLYPKAGNTRMWNIDANPTCTAVWGNAPICTDPNSTLSNMLTDDISGSDYEAIDGNVYSWESADGSVSYSDGQISSGDNPDLNNGEWVAVFSYDGTPTKIYGSSVCGNSENANHYGPLPEADYSNYVTYNPGSGPTCWCRVDGYELDGGVRRAMSPNSGWIDIGVKQSQISDCDQECAEQCVTLLATNTDFRLDMNRVVCPIKSSIVNYVCTPGSVKNNATTLDMATYGQSFTLADGDTTCERGGYGFDQWVCEGDNTGTSQGWESLREINPWDWDENVTCTADWTPNTINLEWFSNGVNVTNTINNASSCEYGVTLGMTPINRPANRTGYTFNGWRVSGWTAPSQQ